MSNVQCPKSVLRTIFAGVSGQGVTRVSLADFGLWTLGVGHYYRKKREQLALLPLLFWPPFASEAVILYICRELEDELHCQLHVTTLDVAVRRYAFNGSDKSAGNVLSARSDVKICVVEGVKHLAPKLQRVSLTDSDVARNSSVNVPIARTTKLVASRHAGRIWTKVRAATAHCIAKRSNRLTSEVKVVEEVRVTGVGDINGKRTVCYQPGTG